MSDELIQMSEYEYLKLRDFINEFSGLYFDDTSKFFLEKRLNNRLQLHQFTSFEDYYFFLKYDRKKEEEISAIAEVLTTNETYFFREEPQLKAFTEEILPEIKKEYEAKGIRDLRIWSAGCSTGEEPYTLAMLIKETGLFEDWNIEIFGSDISLRVLKTARNGVYSRSSFRATKQEYIDRYFTPIGDGDQHRINDEIRSMITFGQLNMIDSVKASTIDAMDIIFCRNVIIYFDKDTKKKVIEMFHERLKECGFLFLGHSETLMNISNKFVLRHYTHDMVYQKPTLIL
ncbi:CheR family methyltransferase [Thermodesulfobacteriota bacterium]